MSRLLSILAVFGLLTLAPSSAQVPGMFQPLLVGSGSNVLFVRTANNTIGSGTSQSFSFNATGCNFLVAVLTGRNGGTISAVSGTYNGVALTARPVITVGGDNNVVLLYLFNPASGSNTLTVSWTTSLGFANLGAACYSGAVGTVGAQASNTVTGVSANNVSAVSGSGQIVVSGIVTNSGALTSGNTQDFQVNSGASYSGGLSHAAGAGSVNMNWTWAGGAGSSAIAAFSIQ